MAVTGKSTQWTTQQPGKRLIPTPGLLYAKRTLKASTGCIYTGVNDVTDSSIALRFYRRPMKLHCQGFEGYFDKALWSHGLISHGKITRGALITTEAA